MTTLDQLTNRLESELKEFKHKEGTILLTPEYDSMERQIDARIVDAKIATAVLFLTKERGAMESGLPRYRALIHHIFGDSPVLDTRRTSPWRVLTFNYDRLFESALLEYIRETGQHPEGESPYGPFRCNAGFPGGPRIVHTKWDSECFGLVKLHGSVGWWVKKAAGNKLQDDCREYWPMHPPHGCEWTNIEKLCAPGLREWEPLIVFPHEKQRAQAGGTDFKSDPYVRSAWDQAKRWVSEAIEIRFIGFSFQDIDRASVVNRLLKDTHCAVHIQNPKAHEICRILEAEFDFLRGRLHLDPSRF